MTNSQQPKAEMTKEEIEEREHFRKVIAAFKSYKRDSEARLSRSHMNLKRLPLAHQQLLIKYGFKIGLENLESCVELNHNVLTAIISDASTMFDNPSYNGENADDKNNIQCQNTDLGN